MEPPKVYTPPAQDRADAREAMIDLAREAQLRHAQDRADALRKISRLARVREEPWCRIARTRVKWSFF